MKQPVHPVLINVHPGISLEPFRQYISPVLTTTPLTTPEQHHNEIESKSAFAWYNEHS
jgi:hypothetical protein